ncbi:MAG: preprotein translocase subunit SecE [Candidatus Moranbacteria bacterium]|nr:preprotein translocase subunit SecE [Candidatus Moranbacteria bacterium]
MANLFRFLQEAKVELLKVNWPNRETIIKYTMLVIVMSLIVAVFLGGLDYFFSYLVETFLLK